MLPSAIFLRYGVYEYRWPAFRLFSRIKLTSSALLFKYAQTMRALDASIPEDWKGEPEPNPYPL